MTRLIGLSGKKRAGKDTAAATLISSFGFQRYAFADPLKKAALDLDPLILFEQDEGYLMPRGGTWEPAYERLGSVVNRLGWEQAKEIREVRRTLQNYGVAIRQLQPDFWIRTTLGRALATPRPVVITDVRFPNEAAAIETAGGVVIRIERPGLESDDTHASETALDDYYFEHVLHNDGTVEDLAAKVEALFYRL